MHCKRTSIKRELDIIILLLVCAHLGSAFDLESLEALLMPRRRQEDWDLSETIFPNLMNIEMSSTKKADSDYPWIARVTHSDDYLPHICTASCIGRRIFITSAGCIFSLKVSQTTVIYQNSRLPAIAFILSDNTTKQLFDDIGWIIVKAVDEEKYNDVSSINPVMGYRTGEGFKWFADWNLPTTHGVYKVVGFATDKAMKENAAAVKYYLSELDVVVDINLCPTILSVGGIKGFYTPCYHSCTLQEHEANDVKCKRYHGVEGGAVVDVKARQLIGVATWSAATRKTILPVGFAVPNSNEFLKNSLCANTIVKYTDTSHNTPIPPNGYQSICSGSHDLQYFI